MARSPLHQLTPLEIANAKPTVKPYTLSDGGRLYILIKLDGAKLWRWNYDFAGKTKTMALGGWPEVSEKEARAAHAAGRELLRHGIDPVQRRREAKAQARFNADATFEAVAKVWSGSRKRTGLQTIWTRSSGGLLRTSIRSPCGIYRALLSQVLWSNYARTCAISGRRREACGGRRNERRERKANRAVPPTGPQRSDDGSSERLPDRYGRDGRAGLVAAMER